MIATQQAKPRKLKYQPLTFDRRTSRRRVISDNKENEYVLMASEPKQRSVSLPTSYQHSNSMANLTMPSSPYLAAIAQTRLESLQDKLCTNHIDAYVTDHISTDQLDLIVPTIVKKCVDFLEANEPMEGIFRINGSIRKIKRIETQIRQQGIDKFEFATCTVDGEAPNVYDVAMVLKRWMSTLDNSLVTPEVNSVLKSEPKVTVSPSLQTLPVENVNLLLFILDFLNRLSSPETVKLTRMNASNLAKIFQLTVFKSDDLTVAHPLFAAGLPNNSSESLLQGYKLNEELLGDWIINYPTVFASLQPIVLEKRAELVSKINQTPRTRPEHSLLEVPHSEKASRRRSMYKSLSSVFTNSSFNISGMRKSSNSSESSADSDVIMSDDAVDSHHMENHLTESHHSSRKPLGLQSQAIREQDANTESNYEAKPLTTVNHEHSRPRRVSSSMFADRRLSALFSRHEAQTAEASEEHPRRQRDNLRRRSIAWLRH